MTITVCSYFRDSMVWHDIKTNQVNKFFEQINQQSEFLKSKGLDINFNLVLLENGSKDNTNEVILENIKNNKNATFIKLCENLTNIPVGSNERKERFINLSKIGNVIIETAKQIDSDYIFWIESDLLLPDESTIYNLLQKIEEDENIGIVAPIIFIKNLDNNIHFYDTWAYQSEDKTIWTDRYPYNEVYISSNERYIKMNSIGSCCLMKSKHMENVNFGKNCFRELCAKMKGEQKQIILDTKTVIWHPSDNGFIKQRWI